MNILDTVISYVKEFIFSMFNMIGRNILKGLITETRNEDGSITYVFSTWKYKMAFKVSLGTTLQSLKDMGIETVNDIRLDYVPLPYLNDRTFFVLLGIISERISLVNNYPTMFLSKQTPNNICKYVPIVANTFYHKI